MKVVIIAAFGLIVGYTAYNSQKKDTGFSNLLLDNVEALASESNKPQNAQNVDCEKRSIWDTNRQTYMEV